MTEVILTIGVSASGKSTWAKEQVAKNPNTVIVCRDDIREEILNPFSWKKWNWKWEDEVTARHWDRVEDAVNNFRVKTIIIADTNLNKNTRQKLTKQLAAIGVNDVTPLIFPVSWEEALARDTARANGVGISVLAKQFEQFEKQFLKTPQYTPSAALAAAWMFDMDGTLTKPSSSRSMYDWDKVDRDEPNQPVINLAKALHTAKNHIIVVSGRDELARTKTKQWLERHEVPYLNLFMRTSGDYRKDSVVKSEIFWKKIAPNWQVMGVVDDRPQVCRCWRSIGLNVLQVGNPYIEF